MVGKTDTIIERDKSGRIIYRQDDRGFEYQNLYDLKGNLQAILHSGKIQRRYLYHSVTGELLKEIRFAESGNIVIDVKIYIKEGIDRMNRQFKWINGNQLSSDVKKSMIYEAREFIKSWNQISEHTIQ